MIEGPTAAQIAAAIKTRIQEFCKSQPDAHFIFKVALPGGEFRQFDSVNSPDGVLLVFNRRRDEFILTPGHICVTLETKKEMGIAG